MRVPLVVLTGFLGSGKTTLLNALLASRAAGETPPIAVIVNELGKVDIDGALLAAHGGQTRQIQLPGGCVCCVMGDDLEKTLLDVVRENPQLSAIVLETTGVAGPLPIAWAASKPPASDVVRMAAVITLVDATNFIPSRGVSGAVDAQVAYADVVLITKSELPGAQPGQTIAAVRTLAERAIVRVGSTAEHARWLDELLADPPIAPAPSAAQPVEPGHVHDAHCGHGTHGIETAAIDVPGRVDLEELEDQLAELPPTYVRIKGIVDGTDGRTGAAGWFAIHRVGLRVSSEAIDLPTHPTEGRLVALGTGVDPAMLRDCIERSRA